MQRKFWISGIISLLVLSTTTVFALSSVSEKQALGEMQEMHEQMTQNIKDSQLKDQMDEMHEDCISEYKDGGHHSNSFAGGHMKGMHM